jgi:hypothetical protein
MGKVSFNLYRDDDLVAFLDTERQLYSEIHDSTGMINIPVKILQQALRQSGKLNLRENTVTRLQSDLALARAKKEDIVTYYCF